MSYIFKNFFSMILFIASSLIYQQLLPNFYTNSLGGNQGYKDAYTECCIIIIMHADSELSRTSGIT